ncbi:PAS domain-containing sensor histidine kinase [Pontibacter sp. CAU 1760]
MAIPKPSAPVKTTPYSAAFYQALVTNSTHLISVINKEGVYTYVGAPVKAHLGYEQEELLGRSALEFIHPDDLPRAVEVLQMIESKEYIQMPPFRFKAKCGAWRWMQSNVTNMLGNAHVQGIVTNSKDVTEAVEAEEQKARQQAYYESLFLEHPEAVFTLDNTGHFQQTNRHMEQLSGYTEAETLGRHYSVLLQNADLPLANKAFRNVITGAAQQLELSFLDKEAQEKNLFLTLIPVRLGGETVGVQGIAQDITQGKVSQELLYKQALELQNIVESIPEPFVVLDNVWRIEYANTAYAASLGMKMSALNGQNIWDLKPGLKYTGFYAKCQEVAASKTALRFEETYTTKEATETFQYSIFPTDKGLAVHILDNTVKKATQHEFEKLSLVASKSTNGIVIMDSQCRIEWVNEGFSRLTGYSLEEVRGLVPSMILQGPDSDPEVGKRIRDKYRSQRPFSEEILNYRKNGETFWFKIDVNPVFDEQGALVNYIAIETDITEKKEDEKKLTKLADDLLKHNRNLQQFAYVVSHNLRAPVANAIGLASLVKKLDKHSDTYDLTIDKLQVSVQQLDSVIKDISHILAVRDAGGLSMRKLVNFREVCEEVLLNFEEQLQECQTHVSLEIDGSFQLLSIRAYLYSVLYNLVSNAIKFRRPDRPLALRIKVEKDKRGFVLTFTDNGLGMDMHVVEHQLFKLYNRFHPEVQGKGIGLFLVKTQVESLGGKIVVDSAPQVGTTFKILLGMKHV